MQQRALKTLSWTDVLAALRASTGESVLIRDSKQTKPAAAVKERPGAKGPELCLFSGEEGVGRLALLEQLETLSKAPGRRFMTSAKADADGSALLIDRVADETIDGKLCVVATTRRKALGFNQSQQTGDSSPFRSKRIKNG